MEKLRIFWRRLRHASFKRMHLQISAIHKETKLPHIVIFFDMVWCSIRYGVGYLDYHVFGFAKKPKEKRLTYMTMRHSEQLVRKLNDRDYYYVFDDKITFDERFSAFLGRKYLDLRTATVEDLRNFCAGQSTVFAKVHDKCGGEGISRITIDESVDYDTLYAECKEKGQLLIEEAITQHEEMDKLCPSSINTVRIVTVLDGDEAKFIYALVRMGSGTGCVDNISSGGMYTGVNEDGILTRPAFCDKTGLYYDEHPLTHTVFNGFQIPFFEEAKKMCCRAALVEPHMRYVGWDVAITPDGPVFVEGNNLPGYDMVQNSRHRDEGILPLFREKLGEDIFD